MFVSVIPARMGKEVTPCRDQHGFGATFNCFLPRDSRIESLVAGESLMSYTLYK